MSISLGLIDDEKVPIVAASVVIPAAFSSGTGEPPNIAFATPLDSSKVFEDCTKWIAGLEGDVSLIVDLKMAAHQGVVTARFGRQFSSLGIDVSGNEGLFSVFAALENTAIRRLLVFFATGSYLGNKITVVFREFFEKQGLEVRQQAEGIHIEDLTTGRQFCFASSVAGYHFKADRARDAATAFAAAFARCFGVLDKRIARALEMYGRPWAESWPVVAGTCHWHHDDIDMNLTEKEPRYALAVHDWLSKAGSLSPSLSVTSEDAKALGNVYPVDQHPFAKEIDFGRAVPASGIDAEKAAMAAGTWAEAWAKGEGRKRYEAKPIRKLFLEACFRAFDLDVRIHGNGTWRLPVSPGLPFLVGLRAFFNVLEAERAPATQTELMSLSSSSSDSPVGEAYCLVISLAHTRLTGGVEESLFPFGLARAFYWTQPDAAKGLNLGLTRLLWCDGGVQPDEKGEGAPTTAWRNLFAGRRATPEHYRLPAPPVAVYMTPDSIQLYWT